MPVSVTVTGVSLCVIRNGRIVRMAGCGERGGSGTGAALAPSCACAPPPGRTFINATTHGSASTTGPEDAPSPSGLKAVRYSAWYRRSATLPSKITESVLIMLPISSSGLTSNITTPAVFPASIVSSDLSLVRTSGTSLIFCSGGRVLSNRADPSNPLKILFDLSPRDAQHYGAAVRADRGVGRLAELLEDVRHLLVRQRVVRFDRRMTGGRRGDALDGRVHTRAAIEAFQILRQRPQRSGAILAPEQCRTRSYTDRFAAEFLQLESETREIRRVRRQRLSCGGGQIHQHWNEHPLTFERAARGPLRDAFEQHALMGHVLIDDRNPLIVDGNDEGVTKLTERSHWTDGRLGEWRTCCTDRRLWICTYDRQCARIDRRYWTRTNPTRPTRLTSPSRRER